MVERLSLLLVELDATLLAWALMTNHLHLLLRIGDASLATLMERLLTAYALRFNRLNHRTGHLFQNRYKSLVCEEQEYLLQIIRYLHLNPLRAGLVSTLERLDLYPWSGHAVLLGNVRMPGQAVEEVLAMFGGTLYNARRNYREFVAQGVPLGHQPELVGNPNPGRPREEQGPSSSRVLGSEGFLKSVLEASPGKVEVPLRSLSLAALQNQIARRVGVEPADLQSRARGNLRSRARALFCFLAVNEQGYSAAEVGRFLGISGWAVGKAVRRGRGEADAFPECGARIRLIP